MTSLSAAATALIALLQVYVLTLEMFLWTTPRGHRAFNMTPKFADQSKVLAANQGLYNGFLAAGLVWGVVHPVEEFATQIRLFFLSTVVIAGLYGGATAVRKIWAAQMLPAMICFGIVYLEL